MKSNQKRSPNTSKKEIKALQGKPIIQQWYPLFVAMLLVLITWWIYQPSLQNGFTNWDDNFYVLKNDVVKQPLSRNSGYFFVNESAGNYHPLTMISLSMDYHLAGGTPSSGKMDQDPDAWWFHVTGLVFHLMTVVLVFVFIYRLSRKRLLVAGLTALLFAIHPMHVESVAWISERKDVLYAFFFMAALIAYLKYLEKPDLFRYLAVGTLYLASLFSKPAAVIFPLTLFAIDYFSGRQITLKVVLEKVPLLILSVIFGVVTYLIQRQFAESGMQVFTLFQRVMFASYGFIMYPWKLLFPYAISAYYPYPGITPDGTLPAIFYLSPLLALLVVAGIVVSTRFTRVIPFGFLFYFISVMLVLQFMPVGNAIMADRYGYISSVGLFFILAWYVNELVTSRNATLRWVRWIVAVFLVVYCIILGITAFRQTLVWQNSDTLWSDVISKYPEAYVAYENRGNHYADHGDYQRAAQDYETYLDIRKDSPRVYNSLGNCYKLLNQPEKAVAAYTGAIALSGSDPRPILNRAITRSVLQEYDSALVDFNRVLVLNPGSVEVYQSRAVLYQRMKSYRNAAADFSKVIAENPDSAAFYMDRGYCYFKLQEFQNSRADYEKCVALNPANATAWYNLSAVCNELKDYRQAYQSALKARSFGYPVNPALLETLQRKL